MHLYPLLAVLFVAVRIATAAAGQAPASQSDAQQILSKVRGTYATATAWHFEHTISIEETEGTAPPVKLADVVLVTAIGASKGGAVMAASAPFCPVRCRLEARTKDRGTTLLVRDGTSTWLYSSARGEYLKGTTPTDVLTSVGGSMLLAVHMGPLGLQSAALTGVRRLGDEVLEIDRAKRECYVLEATLTSSGLSLGAIERRQSPDPDPAAFSTPSGLFQLLALQGLTIGNPRGFYLAAEGAPPALVRLWVDKERYLVLRRSTTQTAARLAPEQLQQRSQPQSVPVTTQVTLRMEDAFSRAHVGDAVDNAVFAFQPPPGSREIPNVRAR